jgi:outer membrane murein-binding lipoprotein Lpp
METRGRGIRRLAAAGCLGVLALGACGSDDESAQDQYCEAGADLKSSLASLADLDLIGSGTDGLNDAIEQVSDDVDALRDSASGATADDVEALEASVDALEETISTLGDDVSGANLTAVRDAIGEVSAAAQAVISTLSDC